MFCLFFVAKFITSTIIRHLEKIFSIKSYDVSDCVSYFNCTISNSIHKRKTNFLAKLKCSDNLLTGLFLNVISTELSATELCT